MRFVRWGGGCAGEGGCLLTLAGAASVTALFAPETYRLTLGVQGKGAIVSSATTVPCRRRCGLAVTSYQAVSLRAVAQAGWRFKRWAGSCRGTRPSCSLQMEAASAATALFVRKRAL
jgi:hypothetical protein